MAVPAPIAWVHDGISEREVAHYWPSGEYDNAAWEDCTWDSFIMYLRMSFRPSIPSTHYEAELARKASGEDTHSGSNPNDLRKAAIARYGIQLPPAITGWSNIRLALSPGRNGVISGSMRAFPYGHRLRRPQPGFAGNHAVHAAKIDANPRYWVTNPLFPEDHDGEWWSEDEMRRFVQAGVNLWSVVSKTLPKPVVTQPKPPAQTVTVPAGAGFWRYRIAGTRSTGYTISRESKVSARGFTAHLGASRIDTKDNPGFPSGTWGGKRRVWAKIVDGGSAGTWIDTLEGSNIIVRNV